MKDHKLEQAWIGLDELTGPLDDVIKYLGSLKGKGLEERLSVDWGYEGAHQFLFSYFRPMTEKELEDAKKKRKQEREAKEKKKAETEQYERELLAKLKKKYEG